MPIKKVLLNYADMNVQGKRKKADKMGRFGKMLYFKNEGE